MEFIKTRPHSPKRNKPVTHLFLVSCANTFFSNKKAPFGAFLNSSINNQRV
jgi:hypothetical protein